MVKRFILVLVSVSLFCCSVWAQGGEILRFVYCSDLHYGLVRDFRGEEDVPADSVSRAMIASFGLLEKTALPLDGGVGQGQVFGEPEFIVCTGDIANRMQHGVQTASESWTQFCRDWEEYLDRMYLVPGNHDISNAIGYPKPMSPDKDAASAVGIYDMMMSPDTAVTADNFDYAVHKTHYTFVADSIRFVFVGMWPDSHMREWYSGTVETGEDIPVLLFTHDPPDADAKHFTNPWRPHDINSADKFENLLTDTCSVRSIDRTPKDNWQELERFLSSHPEIKAWFHGDWNYNEFYTWTGVDGTVSLPVFRVDSPMKGDYSSVDETLLSYIVVTVDAGSRLLTARECLWNPDGAAGIRWGASCTVAL